MDLSVSPKPEVLAEFESIWIFEVSSEEIRRDSLVDDSVVGMGASGTRACVTVAYCNETDTGGGASTSMDVLQDLITADSTHSLQLRLGIVDLHWQYQTTSQ